MKRARLCFILSTLLLAGCGSVSMPDISLWPFGESASTERDRRPANATEYRCAGGKAFYVRRLDDGAVWLIAPDRELRLEKTGESTYGVGRVSLALSADGATLTDPPNSLVGCITGAAKK